MPLRAVGALALLFVLLGHPGRAVEPDKAQYRYDTYNLGHSPWPVSEAFDPALRSYRHWGYRLQPQGTNEHHIAVIGPDGTLYTYTNSSVNAFKPYQVGVDDGDQARALLWVFNGVSIPSDESYGLALRNGRLYVADTDNQRLLALDARSGALLWEMSLSFKPANLLLASGNDLVVSGGDQVCRVRDDGGGASEVWCTEVRLVDYRRPALDEGNGLLYATSKYGLSILDAHTGEVYDRLSISIWVNGVRYDLRPQSPVYDPNTQKLYFGADDQVEGRWRYYAVVVPIDPAGPSAGSPVVRELIDIDVKVYTGYWGTPTLSPSGRYAYFPTSYGAYLCRWDLATDEVNCTHVDSHFFTAPVIGSNGPLVVPSHTRAVHIFWNPEGANWSDHYYIYVTNSTSQDPFAETYLDFENEVAVDRCGNIYITGNEYLHAFGPAPCLTDVELSKTASETSVQVGDTLTFTITAFNRGRRPVFDLVVRDALPEGFALVSASASRGSYSAADEEWTVPELRQNESATLTLTVRAVRAGTYTNTAEVVAQVGWDEDSEPNNHDPNEDDQASVTVEVRPGGVPVSGTLYHDLQPNGFRDAGEAGVSPAEVHGASLYVKLFADTDGNCENGFQAPALQVVEVDDQGNYRFAGVPEGRYCLVLSADNDPARTDAYAPGPDGWLYTSPPGGVRPVEVGDGASVGNDFGLFHGARVQGTVFRDTGDGDGVANDAVQNGSEPGIPRVEVEATDGTHTRRATTDAEGRYTLYIPADWGTVTVSHPLRPASGYNDGSRAVRAASWAEASASDAPAARAELGNAADLAGTASTLNFGVVFPSVFRPDQNGTTTTPGTLVYAHTYRPGSQGRVNLARIGGRYTYQVRVDANCDGDFDDPGELWQGVSSAEHPGFDVGDAWPRNPDGSFAACALEVRVLVPDGEPEGAVDLAEIEAALSWANNTGVVDRRTVVDTTQVRILGALRLEKRGRRVDDPAYDREPASFPSDYAVSVEGAPGNVLEYCIGYQNVGTDAVTSVVISDPVPFFSIALSDAYGVGRAIYWRDAARVEHYLTAASGDDAGEIDAGVVRVRAESSLPPGKGGLVCYRVRIR